MAAVENKVFYHSIIIAYAARPRIWRSPIVNQMLRNILRGMLEQNGHLQRIVGHAEEVSIFYDTQHI